MLQFIKDLLRKAVTYRLYLPLALPVPQNEPT
jgi:hypothetical protein